MLAQLRAEFPNYMNAARQAEIGIKRTIGGVLEPSVYQLLDRASQVRDQLRPLRKMLLAFIEQSPNGSDHSTEIGEAVLSFLGTMWKDSGEARENPWDEIRARLRADPYTQLPDPSLWTKINKGESE